MSKKKQRRLLVIEDDAAVVVLLSRLLEPRGWKIDAAQTLEASENALRQSRYDAVLLDLGLPDSPREITIARLPWIRDLTRPARLAVITGMIPVPEAEALGLVVLEKGAEGILARLLAAIGD